MEVLHHQLRSPANKFYNILFKTFNPEDDPNHEYYRHDWWKNITDGIISIRILTGVFYHGNAESMAGSGCIYATETHASNGIPRYDFVTVQGEGNTVELAQVLNFVELSRGHLSRLFAIVAWLQVDTDVVHKEGLANHYFHQFKYDRFYPGTSRSNAFICNIDMIDCAAILGHAYVAPVFSTIPDVTKAKPAANHRFYYVDRRWVDQSDWLDSIPKPRDLLLRDPEAIAEYLERMLTGRRRDNSDDEEENDIDNDDRGYKKKKSAGREKKKKKRSAPRSDDDDDEVEDDDDGKDIDLPFDIDLMNERLLGVEEDSDEEFY
jgi:hypothetical protein